MPVTVDYNNIDVDSNGSTFASAVKTEVLAVQTDLGKMSEKTETETIAGNKTHSGTLTRNKAFFSAYSTSTSALADAGALTNIAWDEVDESDSMYSLGGSDIEITISEAGRYLIKFDGTAINDDVSNTLAVVRWKLQKKPSGGSFSDVGGTKRYSFHRNIPESEMSASLSGKIITVVANDVIKLVAGVSGSTDTSGDIKQVADGISIYIERI